MLRLMTFSLNLDARLDFSLSCEHLASVCKRIHFVQGASLSGLVIPLVLVILLNSGCLYRLSATQT